VIGARWFVSGRGGHRCTTVRHPYFGMRAAQRSASGAPLAGMEIGTDDGTGQIRKMPRLTGRASGVTCTRLLGRMAM